MIHDYAAFQLSQMHDLLEEIDQIGDRLRDRQTKKIAEKELEQETKALLHEDPHTAYLWFESKKHGQEHKKNTAIVNAIKNAWGSNAPSQSNQKWHQQIHIVPDFDSMGILPPFSFFLKFTFKLKKPYLSKDEEVYYLLENPVRKEKIFKTPMIASTSWKGALRYAFWQMEFLDNDDIIKRLFGNPRGCVKHEELQAGRLHFYPSFFKNKQGFDIINPHDREKGTTTERGPNLLEAVMKDSQAVFALAYIPLFTSRNIYSEVTEDLKALAEGIQAMMTVYGFGAKTSSGFGVAKNDVSHGKLSLTLPSKIMSEATPTQTGQEIQQRFIKRSFKTLKELCGTTLSLQGELE